LEVIPSVGFTTLANKVDRTTTCGCCRSNRTATAQAIYLIEISHDFVEVLAGLIGAEAGHSCQQRTSPPATA
jgi:hypothetical protein